MNIFYLHSDPRACAEMHNDKHVVKMILEYAQLLSTAHRVVDGELKVVEKYVNGSLPARYRKSKVWELPDARDGILYKATHMNHPSAVWARKTDANYKWLYSLFIALMKEYTFRYEKEHACSKLIDALSKPPTNIAKGEFTQPTPAMPDEYKEKDSVVSYHNYYIGSKHEMSYWTKRHMPEWFISGINKKYDEACFIFMNRRDNPVSTSSINM